jgi:hypothetical protein
MQFRLPLRSRTIQHRVLGGQMDKPSGHWGTNTVMRFSVRRVRRSVSNRLLTVRSPAVCGGVQIDPTGLSNSHGRIRRECRKALETPMEHIVQTDFSEFPTSARALT